MDKKQFIKLIIMAVSVGVLIGVDMLTKSYFDGKYIPIIEGVVSFTSSHNTGAAFSMLNDNPTFLLVITIVFLLMVVVFGVINFKNSSKTYNIGYVLILAGALGNFIDRVALGYVRDFISLDIIHFAIFNFADSCLTIGVMLVIIYLLFIKKEEKKA